ncbi:hypothetical protein PUN28_012999 [Cardiocondyla obscurior]|uniref:Uncharacterized protein n=1 Tax=Cardiocondyla obscurior TaxID=286306 RepID=A0AAW2F7P9_9HYME
MYHRPFPREHSFPSPATRTESEFFATAENLHVLYSHVAFASRSERLNRTCILQIERKLIFDTYSYTFYDERNAYHRASMSRLTLRTPMNRSISHETPLLSIRRHPTGQR